jgi:hypothetical protein
MKVLKPGRAKSGWADEFECTGAGNNVKGCGALLEVEMSDLFQTGRHCYDGSSEYFVTFKCGHCGALNDIPDDKQPCRYYDLPARRDWEQCQLSNT